MEQHTFKGAIILLASLLLSACNTMKEHSKSQVSSVKQVEQIASIIAGASYLKSYCGKTTIPNEQNLYTFAKERARKRGWDINASEYQMLPEVVKQQQLRLMNDTASQELKCASLSSSLVVFFPDK